MTPADQVAEMRARGWTLRDIADVGQASYCAIWNAAHERRIRPRTVAAIADAWAVYGGHHPGLWANYLHSVPSGVQVHRGNLSTGAEIAVKPGVDWPFWLSIVVALCGGAFLVGIAP